MRIYLVSIWILSILLFAGCSSKNSNNTGTVPVSSQRMVILGYNDLGMHCMNKDFSELMVLPPANTMHAQVIDRSGGDPRIVTSGISIEYSIPGNTESITKTNFWKFGPAMFGKNITDNIGLFGNGLAGNMVKNVSGNFWEVTGVPLTPIQDNGNEDPYQLALLTVKQAGVVVASTRSVMPVSWEMRCDLCHIAQPGETIETDILRKHDTLHNTNLLNSKPVKCSSCHADPAIGEPGVVGRKSLSAAMHGAHSTRMDTVAGKVDVSCYSCHPGIKTKCQRDIHHTKGLDCFDCHKSMEALASNTRTPWVDEPKCSDCHHKSGSQYEQANTLYRNSVGHHNIRCASCHGSPHAITPTDPSITNNDNLQAIATQGHAGVINQCAVCHSEAPDDSFPHSVNGG